MRVLISWLRDFVDIEVEANELADMLSMRGFELAAIESPPNHPGNAKNADGDDAVLDLEITANRPDCLSVIGIAREVATAYNLPFKKIGETSADAISTFKLVTKESSELAIELEDPNLCPRYAATVVESTKTTSPKWMTYRLLSSGIRPINPIVDITNYVLMELGHPIHAFDLDRLIDCKLRIRPSEAGEFITTLDGEQRKLTKEMLVIADAEQAQAVAGVMGGANSEVGTETKRVVFESAYFDPTSVRKTSKLLGLKTEASSRFERGADINAPVMALERACGLLVQLGAGQPRGQVIDRYPKARHPLSIALRQSRINLILGKQIDSSEVDKTLTGLGFVINKKTLVKTIVYDVKVPTRRVDISREIDLVEEVGRCHGYDKLPTTFPSLDQPTPPPDPKIEQDRLLRRILNAGGFSEAATFTFIEKNQAQRFSEASDLVPIANPLSEKFSVLRPLITPGLIEAVAHNYHRERHDVRLFEIGACFSRQAGERQALGLIWTGAAIPNHWSTSNRNVDLYDVIGVVERLCLAFGVQVLFTPTSRDYLVEGRTAAITKNKDINRTLNPSPLENHPSLGQIGQLSPSIAEAYGLRNKEEIYVAEFDLNRLKETLGNALDNMHVQPLPRYPSIIRDVSIIIDETLPASAVRDTISVAAPEILTSVVEFDRYQGKGVRANGVSLSLRLTFQSAERTLTDAEVQQAIDAIISELKRTHNAELRQ